MLRTAISKCWLYRARFTDADPQDKTFQGQTFTSWIVWACCPTAGREAESQNSKCRRVRSSQGFKSKQSTRCDSKVAANVPWDIQGAPIPALLLPLSHHKSQTALVDALRMAALVNWPCTCCTMNCTMDSLRDGPLGLQSFWSCRLGGRNHRN